MIDRGTPDASAPPRGLLERVPPHSLEAEMAVLGSLLVDGEMLGVAAFLSLGAGLIAGVYPAWRIGSIQPALQLKVE